MRDRLWFAGSAALFASLAALVYAVSRGTSGGVSIDESIATDLEYSGGTRLDSATHLVLWSVDAAVVAAAMLALVVATLGRRAAAAATAAGVLLAAGVGSALTKRMLEGIDPFEIEVTREGVASSFPSGHTTLAAGVAASLVILALPLYRLAAALGGAGYTAAVGMASVSDGGHYPSDALGAVLVALTCGAVGLSALAGGPPTRIAMPSTGASATITAAVVVPIALVLAGLIYLAAGPDGVRDYWLEHGEAAIAIAVIVIVSTAGLLFVAGLAGGRRGRSSPIMDA